MVATRMCPNLSSAWDAMQSTYTSASTSKPSDSFPGLMSIVTGSNSKDDGRLLLKSVAYDRSL